MTNDDRKGETNKPGVNTTDWKDISLVYTNPNQINEYNNATYYEKGHIVSYKNSYYIFCYGSRTKGEAPDYDKNNTYWLKLNYVYDVQGGWELIEHFLNKSPSAMEILKNRYWKVGDYRLFAKPTSTSTTSNSYVYGGIIADFDSDYYYLKTTDTDQPESETQKSEKNELVSDIYDDDSKIIQENAKLAGITLAATKVALSYDKTKGYSVVSL
jgi:hypothetical protein